MPFFFFLKNKQLTVNSKINIILHMTVFWQTLPTLHPEAVISGQKKGSQREPSYKSALSGLPDPCIAGQGCVFLGQGHIAFG